MAEAGTTEAPAAEEQGTTTAQAEQPKYGTFINEDGTLKDGWDKTLIPEEFQGRQVFKSFSDLPSLMKLVGNQDALIKRQGKGIFPPDENTTPAEKEAFFKALGRPEAPDGYKIESPEELKEFYDESVVKQWQQVFHDAGLTPKQAEMLVAAQNKQLTEGQASLTAAMEKSKEEGQAALKTKWGAAYDSNLHVAQRVFAENVADKDLRARIDAKFGNDPDMIEFAASIGKKFVEHRVITPEASTGLTPADAKGKIAELESTPGFILADSNGQYLKQTNPGRYQRLIEETEALYNQLRAANNP